MLYAYTHHTPLIDFSIVTHDPRDLTWSGSSAIRSQQMGERWLVVNQESGAWCLLDDPEYQAFRQIESISLQETIPYARTDGSENSLFLHHLRQCGVLGEKHTKKPVDDDPRPFSLTLLSSDRCNLACKYCYLSMAPNQRPSRLGLDLAHQTIRDAFQQAANSILIDFGEIAVNYPFTRDLVLYAERLGQEFPDKKLILAIQTNGTTLTGDILDFLEEHKVIIGVSLDGPRHINDVMRISPSGRGSHARIESGLQEIIRRGMEHIVLCTVSAINIGSATEILDYVLDLGVAHFSFKPVIKRGNAEAEWQSLGVSVPQFCGFLNDVVDYAIHHRNWDALDDRLIKFTFRLLRDPRGWSDACPTADCGCGSNMLVLNPQGVLYPCPRFASTTETGFSLGRDLAQATNTASGFLSQWLSNNVPQDCHECSWWPFCKGGCPMTRQDAEHERPPVDPSCGIYSFSYELIINRILPALNSGEYFRGDKLGKIHVRDVTLARPMM